MTGHENGGYENDEKMTSTTKTGGMPVQNFTNNGPIVG